jgi:hypothetical protein
VSKRKVLKNFDVSVSKKSFNGWKPSFYANANTWYVALYLADKTPYVMRYDGTHWRNSDYKLMAIPLYILPLPPAPVVRSEKADDLS